MGHGVNGFGKFICQDRVLFCSVKGLVNLGIGSILSSIEPEKIDGPVK
jgi:hypothetical protein